MLGLINVYVLIYIVRLPQDQIIELLDFVIFQCLFHIQSHIGFSAYYIMLSIFYLISINLVFLFCSQCDKIIELV
jgi:hypothetical protein